MYLRNILAYFIIWWIISCEFAPKWLSLRTVLMMSQYWVRHLLDATPRQAITWVNINQDRYVVWLSSYELNRMSKTLRRQNCPRGSHDYRAIIWLTIINYLYNGNPIYGKMVFILRRRPLCNTSLTHWGRKNDHHLAKDKFIIWYDNCYILMEISLNVFPRIHSALMS